ncbi:hypothetical protein [Klebsiella pneumoniae]|uniref:hypothetical protein n=1 Tax=Klebsiella pneumoniae TaxID=573 RepID=UPI0013D29D0A
MNIETVNELIRSLESAGELSIREQKFLKLAKAFKHLAAENVAARNAVQVFCDVVGANTDAICEEVGPEGVRTILAAMSATGNMPATSAYLAGIKAEGVEWIEGSEPSEFGRYWVRYETDIGPQYCSAEWMEYNFCASSNTNIHKIWLADHSRSINSLKGVTHYTKLPASLEDRQLREVADK